MLPFIIALLLLVWSAIVNAGAHAPFPRPSLDPFYVVPANISLYANGAVIRVREVNTFINSTDLKQAYQLFYKTTSRDGSADGTVATVWVPKAPTKPFKLVGYQIAEDADNIDCVISYALEAGTASNNTAPAATEAPIVVGWALQRGYYVVQSDSEGSKSAWLVGRTEGMATLDGLRAALNQFNRQKTYGKKVNEAEIALYGYSGGGHSVVWASSVATTSYGNGLNIVGAAYGGTPVDLRSTYTLLNGGPAAILAGAAFFGLANGYPALNTYFQSVAAPSYFTNATTFRMNGYCPIMQFLDGAFVNYTAMFTANVFAPNTPFSRVLANESLLMNVSNVPVPVPLFPRYEYHGTADQIVPYDPERAYVAQQCSNGANIQFVTYVGQDHFQTASNGLSGALSFLEQAFNGTTPSVTCGSPTL